VTAANRVLSLDLYRSCCTLFSRALIISKSLSVMQKYMVQGDGGLWKPGALSKLDCFRGYSNNAGNRVSLHPKLQSCVLVPLVSGKLQAYKR
jgi:hypothetical protein